MTQRPDRPNGTLEQEQTVCVRLTEEVRLEFPDTWANRRGLMIFLRCLQDAEGRPLVTYERIADQLGYEDRRNVHNYWAEFQACGRDLGAYLRRRKKVDDEVVACCEQIWRAHPLWMPAQVHAEVVQRLPAKGATLSVPNIRTAGQQVGFLGIQQALRRQVAQGQAHYKEEGLIEALFALAEAKGEHASQSVAPIPEVVERVAPAAASVQEAPRVAEQAALVEEQLLRGDTSPEALTHLWHGPLGGLLLTFVLYYHGLSLGVLGQFWGVHKTPVMRWLAPLAQINWRAVVRQGRRYFSGSVAVDEKWVKIAGVWWYLFAAVDHVSGMPLHVALLPANSGAYCQLFLLQLKQLGYYPKVIVTDGWDAYVTAMAQVFPHAQHLLCRFHALHAAFRRLKVALADWSERHVWVCTLRQVFCSNDKRTVRRRLRKLQQQASDTPVAGVITRLSDKLPLLLPAVGSTFRPTTSNAVEHFFAAFERFYRQKGPFQSKASADKHLALFLLGYVFSVRSAEAKHEHQGLCPLQRAGYRVAQVPLFHLINRPHLSLLQDRIAQTFAEAA